MTVEIRVLNTIAELQCIPDIEIAVWGLPPKDVVSGNIVRAITLNGGVAHGAYQDERMVGMSLALVGLRGRRLILWSHMTGVLPEMQGQGVGFALKHAQRQWALAHGFSEMRWTFDPLQRGNAHFNLHLLGCVAETYYVDFYGQMEDAINVSAPTDRLEAVWHLNAAHVRALASQTQQARLSSFQSENLILADERSQPVSRHPDQWAQTMFVQIPQRARSLSTDQMIAWRFALREALQTAFTHGYQAVDLLDTDEGSYYVLDRQAAYKLYILVCADGTLYTGIARDLEARLARHNAGKGAAYTASRRPVRAVAAWDFPTRSSALKAEAALKRKSRQAKEALIASQDNFMDGLRVVAIP